MFLLTVSEFKKLKRAKILPVSLFALVMIVVTVFAQGQMSFGESKYIDNASWLIMTSQSLATFFVLPALIALAGSFIICRERHEKTEIQLKLIPVDEKMLTAAKLISSALYGIGLYGILFAMTLIVEMCLHAGAVNYAETLRLLRIYLMEGIGIFIAVSPIIALASKIKKAYRLAFVVAEVYSFTAIFLDPSSTLGKTHPVTAALILSGYYTAGKKDLWSALISMAVCLSLSIFLTFGIREKESA